MLPVRRNVSFQLPIDRVRTGILKARKRASSSTPSLCFFRSATDFSFPASAITNRL